MKPERGELTPFQPFGLQPVFQVRDVAASLAWYRDKLGFTIDFVEGDPPVHARIVGDPTYAAPTVHLRFEPLQSERAPFAGAEVWLHVDHSIDVLYDRYLERGVKIVLPIEDKPWGLRQFVVEDPDGYRLVIAAETPTT
ncbi:MAG: VOC family protein [Myxococcota bacterium]